MNTENNSTEAAAATAATPEAAKAAAAAETAARRRSRQERQTAQNRQGTYQPGAKDIQRDWLLYDADGKVLGRLASAIAHRLRGKHKPTYSPHLDNGDFVVVVNAEKIRTTGRKESNKIYYRHTGYPGGLREQTLAEVRERHPERLLYLAVRGMLPKGPLGRKMLLKLKIYAGPSHPHAAQCPREEKA